MIDGLKRVALAVAVLAVGAAALYFGHQWYERSQILQSTDDAYVRGEITAISSRVSGYAVEVPVNDNFTVKAAQTLARIDPREYRMSV